MLADLAECDKDKGAALGVDTASELLVTVLDRKNGEEVEEVCVCVAKTKPPCINVFLKVPVSPLFTVQSQTKRKTTILGGAHFDVSPSSPR